MALGGRGASPFPILNTMQYVTIATLGNALDFGDLTVARMTRSSGCASPTRGCALGGYQPAISDTIDYIHRAITYIKKKIANPMFFVWSNEFKNLLQLTILSS